MTFAMKGTQKSFEVMDHLHLVLNQCYSSIKNIEKALKSQLNNLPHVCTI